MNGGNNKMATALVNAFAAAMQPPTDLLAPEDKPDQRSRERYPISLELQYKLLRGGRVKQVGTGRTLNISSGGVLIETEDQLPSRGMVEIAMQWPFLLQGVCGLKLVMRGHIVRSVENPRTTAIRAEFREFRTAGHGQLRAVRNR